jgi:hypothetical protein
MRGYSIEAHTYTCVLLLLRITACTCAVGMAVDGALPLCVDTRGLGLHVQCVGTLNRHCSYLYVRVLALACGKRECDVNMGTFM